MGGSQTLPVIDRSTVTAKASSMPALKQAMKPDLNRVVTREHSKRNEPPQAQFARRARLGSRMKEGDTAMARHRFPSYIRLRIVRTT